MAKKNTILIWLLAAVLIVGIAVGLLLDPSVQSAMESNGEYTIQITEICAKNETILADNDGKYRDYIELHNAGEDVDLTGCTLTDGSTVAKPFEGVTMASGEYRVVFLGKETTGFALSSSGRDSIQLKDPNGNIIAQSKVQSLGADQVMSLQGGTYQFSSEPSPGYPNTADGVKAFREGKPVAELSLQINEVLIANRIILPDEKGIFSDVIELYNHTTKPIRLSGWYLSDSTQERLRYRLPDVTIPNGSYLVIYCDGENYVTAEGKIHTNFALTAQEELCLTDPTGAYVTLKPQYFAENTSLAWNGEAYVAMTPSLGYPNTEDGAYLAQTVRINENSPLVISEVLLSDAGVPFEGQFADGVEIYNRSSQTVSTAGWYLSDGGDPYAFPLPQQELQPGEYVTYLINRQTAGFGLSLDETLYLMAPDFMISTPVTCVQPPQGCSISLVGTEEGSAYDFLPVSMGYANNQSGSESFAADARIGSLQISEVMSSNSTYLPGPYGNTTDWVEFYNAGTTSIKLSDYFLTDSSDLQKYPLPDATLAPGTYYVILLSETGKNLRNGYPHLPFNLSSSGDRLYLAKGTAVVDHVIIPELTPNTAWGRPAGKAAFDHLSSPTPGSANSGVARISTTPVADTPQGAYDNVSTLTVSFSGTGEIYYTTDCTTPSRSSKRYTGPITISKTTVFRVVAYETGASRSEILNLTYLINENDSLDTVCLVASPYDLWDENYGIYSTGANPGPYPYQGANYWRNWERSASVALFESDGSLGFYEPCGLKIFGGYSRANTKKSFACMFRGKYGTTALEYPLFGEKGIDCYQSFVLRAGGQDAYMAKMRDEVITSLANDYLGIPVQQYRAVALYVNGSYWGIYFIREKLTDQYVAANFNVHAEDVILSHWGGDECAEYMALQNYARRNDLSKQEHYDYICSQINVDNYTDYVITQMWIENMDLGNVKFFRTEDMKWHWALFDTDLSFYNAASDTVAYNLRKNNIWAYDFASRVLADRLLKNSEYRDNFIRRIAYQVNTVWNEETVIERIDYFYNLLLPDMAKEVRRWGGNVKTWESNVEYLRKFARLRNDYFIPDIQNFFGLTDQQMRDYGFEV